MHGAPSHNRGQERKCQNLDLRGMQVHGDDVICPGNREHIGHEFRRNRSTALKYKDVDFITGKELGRDRYFQIPPTGVYMKKDKSQLIHNMLTKKINNNSKLFD